MTKAYDALIIGAGHNGLVCAFYLAKAGLKVRIVEARDIVGGAAVTCTLTCALAQVPGAVRLQMV